MAEISAAPHVDTWDSLHHCYHFLPVYPARIWEKNPFHIFTFSLLVARMISKWRLRLKFRAGRRCRHLQLPEQFLAVLMGVALCCVAAPARGVPRAVHAAPSHAVPPHGPDDRLPAPGHVLPPRRGAHAALQAPLREDRDHARRESLRGTALVGGFLLARPNSSSAASGKAWNGRVVVVGKGL